ncbi:MAG: SpoIID/LytB domain-containing protein [Armatimonadota bacterium]
MMRILFFAITLLLGTGMVSLLAESTATTPASTTPALPPAPRYTPPSYRDVLTEKEPLRLLMVAQKTMVAWKGDAPIRVLGAADGKEFYLTRPPEMVGMVRVAETNGCTLRKNSQNFAPVPATLRLESDQPIKLWTPNPETWTSYPGPLIITMAADGAFSITREILLEEYLRYVVAGEMPESFHPQALYAQAIIARTYTLAKLGKHAAYGADLCAVVDCQAFGSTTKVKTDEAVKATRGLILLSGDNPAVPYYHANCGGITDDAGYLWGPEYARPYLTGVQDFVSKKAPAELTIGKILAASDAYCKRSNSTKWTKQFTPAQVDALVSANLSKVTGDPTAKIQHVTNMTVEERTLHGRVASLRVEGDGMSILVYGDQVRWLFGCGSPGADGLWSTLFDLTVAKNPAGAITGYALRGAGRGHGIGLCQWGADGRAKAGHDFRTILHAYYPGTRLSDEK